MILHLLKDTTLFGIVFYVSYAVSAVGPAKILAILPFPLKSHNAIFQKYMNGLHGRGHDLIVIAPYPPQRRYSSNYTFVSTGATDLTNSLIIRRQNATGSIYQEFSLISGAEISYCHEILGNAELRKLFTSDERTFDLVIQESLYVHCYLPVAAVKRVPVIWYLAPSRMFAADLAVANVQNPAYFPTLSSRTYEFAVSESSPFLSRLENFKNYLLFYFYHRFYFAPLSERLCREYFSGADQVRCDMHELFKSVSLVLSNSHSVLHRRATVPNHVGIGGLHIEPAMPLPPDLQRLLDESTEKVVYVSFGSTVKISAVEDKLISAFLEAFASCGCTILWKSDLDTSANSIYRLPENVVVRKWFPQRDVLAHKNVNAFISHGGLLSTYEAIYTATPVVGIPLRFDQFDNVRRMAELGVGIHLSYEEVPTGLKTAIREILSNSTFAENMNKLSEVVQDELMSPMDKAIYWTEYVIRHNGTGHLRSSAADLFFYQDWLLDVLGVIVIFTVVILYVCIRIVRLGKSVICRIIFRENKAKKL